MALAEAECVGSPTDAGGGAAEGNASTQSGDIASVEAERDRELSAGGIARA
jgi:hypothetical protein